MPLDPDEADIASLNLQSAVLYFFKRHRFLAYSADEVLFELGAFGVITTREDLSLALAWWVRGRRLILVERADELYYRYDNRLGF